MAVNAWYATRAAVRAALEIPFTSRLNRLVDDSLAAATRDIDNACGIALPVGYQGGAMAPWTGTRYFDWPSRATRGTPTWILRLGGHRLISLSGLVSGGVTIPVADVILQPVNSGPPYRAIELSLATTNAGFISGSSTWQNAVVPTGVWGETDREVVAGALATAVSSSTATTITVTDSSEIGVGSLVRVDSERMVVTGQTLVDTTINTAGSLTAVPSSNSLAVDSGAAFAVGEMITVDSERMLIEDIAGNNLLVRRAVDASVLAAHNTATDIYAPRTLAVARGTYGTSAATHALAATVYAWDTPDLIREWAEGWAIDAVMQKTSGYARTVGSGDNVRNASGAGLSALRCRALEAHGSQLRTAAV